MARRAGRAGRRSALPAWAVCAAAAIATHYFAIFLVTAEAGWLLVTSPRDRRRWGAVLVPVVAGAALLPLLHHQDSDVVRPWTTGYTLAHGVSGTTQQALVGPVWTPLTHVLGVAVLGLLCAGALVALLRDPVARSGALIPAVLLAVLVGVPAVIALVGTDYLVVRNEVVAVALGFMLVAAGCASMRRGMLLAGAICAGGLAIVLAVPVTPALQRNDWRDQIRAGAAGPGPRLWLFLDRFDSTPVSEVYLPSARPLGRGGATVTRIEVIGRGGYPGTAAGPPVAGFRLTSRTERSGIVLDRFIAMRPQVLRSADFSRFDARIVLTWPGAVGRSPRRRALRGRRS